jgi:hypothetical protein
LLAGPLPAHGGGQIRKRFFPSTLADGMRSGKGRVRVPQAVFVQIELKIALQSGGRNARTGQQCRRRREPG